MTGEQTAVLRDSHGRVVTGPDPDMVAAVIQTIGRDGFVTVTVGDAGAEATTYAQVWHRPEGIFQVEYRDGAPHRHWRSLTFSADKAAAFLTSCIEGDDEWRDRFDWQSIGHYFDEPTDEPR